MTLLDTLIAAVQRRDATIRDRTSVCANCPHTQDVHIGLCYGDDAHCDCQGFAFTIEPDAALRATCEQVLADNVLSEPIAAALLVKLKAECEEQHKRAEEAEAVSARLREWLLGLRDAVAKWREDDKGGYDQAIELLGRLTDELDGVLVRAPHREQL